MTLVRHITKIVRLTGVPDVGVEVVIIIRGPGV